MSLHGLEFPSYDPIFEVGHPVFLFVQVNIISRLQKQGETQFCYLEISKENGIQWNVYALPRFQTAADYLRRRGLSQEMYQKNNLYQPKMSVFDILGTRFNNLLIFWHV